MRTWMMAAVGAMMTTTAMAEPVDMYVSDLTVLCPDPMYFVAMAIAVQKGDLTTGSTIMKGCLTIETGTKVKLVEIPEFPFGRIRLKSGKTAYVVVTTLNATR